MDVLEQRILFEQVYDLLDAGIFCEEDACEIRMILDRGDLIKALGLALDRLPAGG